MGVKDSRTGLKGTGSSRPCCATAAPTNWSAAPAANRSTTRRTWTPRGKVRDTLLGWAADKPNWWSAFMWNNVGRSRGTRGQAHTAAPFRGAGGPVGSGRAEGTRRPGPHRRGAGGTQGPPSARTARVAAVAASVPRAPGGTRYATTSATPPGMSSSGRTDTCPAPGRSRGIWTTSWRGMRT